MSANQATLELSITGMSCGSCVRHVAEALRTVDGVVGADVDLQGGRATVTYEAGSASAERMIGAVEKAGYHASPAGNEDPREAIEEGECGTSCCS